MPPQKPWYYLLAYNLYKNIEANSYDPSFRRWYSYDFLSLNKYNWLISSSCGLVCFMDYGKENKIYTSNPILRDCKQLPNPPNGTLSDHNALALSVDKFSQCYQVALMKTKQFRDDFIRWDFTIQVFESKSCLWTTLVNEVLVGWRGERESVICDGILYCLISSFYGSNVDSHGLIMYNINSKSLCNSSMRRMIMVPCPLTCCRLMNLRDRLVMVGGIARLELPVRIEGIGIWTLKDEEWEEVARIPRKLLQRFGEFDDFFASCGAEDLIFIHSYDGPTLLIFDMTKKQWEWTTNCPITKRSPFQVFTGFCFQPSLEIKS
ncbi:F-box/kelch-repeat protein At3g61590-like [Phalaenopsis equestris]|uniref:F-box/kelch-repeat protein At3g61590-like n=1 Tax=Phalaenopsis equestris TaxID=78828 RepID=UPI0009E5CAA8|nr:F-box/kelch-repeat protein At3g61590-like [Phalaenopsis equestris]